MDGGNCGILSKSCTNNHKICEIYLATISVAHMYKRYCCNYQIFFIANEFNPYNLYCQLLQNGQLEFCYQMCNGQIIFSSLGFIINRYIHNKRNQKTKKGKSSCENYKINRYVYVMSFESHNNNEIVLNDYMNGDIFKLKSHVTFNFRFYFKLRTFD